MAVNSATGSGFALAPRRDRFSGNDCAGGAPRGQRRCNPKFDYSNGAEQHMAGDGATGALPIAGCRGRHANRDPAGSCRNRTAAPPAGRFRRSAKGRVPHAAARRDAAHGRPRRTRPHDLQRPARDPVRDAGRQRSADARLRQRQARSGCCSSARTASQHDVRAEGACTDASHKRYGKTRNTA